MGPSAAYVHTSTRIHGNRSHECPMNDAAIMHRGHNNCHGVLLHPMPILSFLCCHFASLKLGLQGLGCKDGVQILPTRMHGR
jgi:hypothetical protein